MSLTSARSEIVYVSRSVVSGFEALAMLAGADAPDDAPLANVDAMIDKVLRDHLDAIPALAERKRALRKAIGEVNAQFADKAKGAA